MKNNKKGFTLLELVIVIAVVAILAAILLPTFAGIIGRSRLSNDVMLCKNLNTSASAIEIDANKKPSTMTENLKLMAENGFNVDKIKASNPDNIFVYDSVNNRFFIYDYVNNVVTYKDENTTINMTDKAHKVNYWIISETYEQTNDNLKDFSVYLKDNYSGETSLTISTGLDVGNNSKISSINYTNAGAKQNVVIRTNSLDSELIINAEHDTVKHFDVVGKVHVIAVDSTNCYEENGKATFTQIDLGKYKTTLTADVKLLFVSNSSNVNFELTEGTVEHAHANSESDADSINLTNPGVIFDYDGNAAQSELDVYHHIEDEDKINLSTNFEDNKTNETVIDIIKEAISEVVVTENENYVARINTTGYETLDAAFEAAIVNDTIVLLKNVAISSAIQIDETANVALDIGNYNVISAGDDGFEVNGGTLTINGTGNVSINGYDFIWIHSGKVVINGGFYKGEGNEDCIFYNQGEIIINDGKFNGKDCIDNGATYGVNGKVTINGGEFTGLNCAIKSCSNPDRIDETGIVGNSYENSSLAIVINNGSFNGLIRVETSYLEINGGYFTSNMGLIHCLFNSALYLNGGTFIGIDDEEVESIIIGGDDSVVKTNYISGNVIINATVAIYNPTIIENGTFNKNITIYKSDAVNPVYEVTVTGGTFGSESSSITITIYRYTSTNVTLNFFGDLKTGDTNINTIRTYDVEKSEETGLYILNLQ